MFARGKRMSAKSPNTIAAPSGLVDVALKRIWFGSETSRTRPVDLRVKIGIAGGFADPAASSVVAMLPPSQSRSSETLTPTANRVNGNRFHNPAPPQITTLTRREASPHGTPRIPSHEPQIAPSQSAVRA